jgi:ABC-type Fe3+-hydroxamate transport system substrate-binding protein
MYNRMEKNKTYAIATIAIVLIAALGVAYIFNSNTQDDDQSKATVTDILGRTVSIPRSDRFHLLYGCVLFEVGILF